MTTGVLANGEGWRGMEQGICPDCGGLSAIVDEVDGETIWSCQACGGGAAPSDYGTGSWPVEDQPSPPPVARVELAASSPETRPRPRNTGLPSRTHELGTPSRSGSTSSRYDYLGGPKPPRPPAPPPPPLRPTQPPVSGWARGPVLAVIAVVVALAWAVTSCHPHQGPGTGGRTGAVCRDGTHSSATGSGACSHHGGVSYWLTDTTPQNSTEPRLCGIRIGLPSGPPTSTPNPRHWSLES